MLIIQLFIKAEGYHLMIKYTLTSLSSKVDIGRYRYLPIWYGIKTIRKYGVFWSKTAENKKIRAYFLNFRIQKKWIFLIN